MFEVSAIFTRVVMKGSVPSGMSNSAESVLGFFSIRIAIAWVPGMALSMVIGTTAPFSAMSGAVTWICALSADPLAPSALRVAATLLVSNAALFHSCANALIGRSTPAGARASVPPALSIPRLSMHRLLNAFQQTPQFYRVRESGCGELHSGQRADRRRAHRDRGDTAPLAHRPDRRRERD